jgi:hypothetical protein
MGEEGVAGVQRAGGGRSGRWGGAQRAQHSQGCHTAATARGPQAHQRGGRTVGTSTTRIAHKANPLPTPLPPPHTERQTRHVDRTCSMFTRMLRLSRWSRMSWCRVSQAGTQPTTPASWLKGVTEYRLGGGYAHVPPSHTAAHPTARSTRQREEGKGVWHKRKHIGKGAAQQHLPSGGGLALAAPRTRSTGRVCLSPGCWTAGYSPGRTAA